MGIFSKLGHKLGHHVKRHWKGWLSGGLLDKTEQRRHKSLLKGSYFKGSRIKANAGKYFGGASRSVSPTVYVQPVSASTYQYQARPIASLMRR